MSPSMSIGQVAAAAAVNIQTIRYYERRGLLSPPRRTSSGYRQYGEEVVGRLRFIKHAQELGFSLKEIDELLALRIRRGTACHAVAHKTRQKIDLVERRIHDLQRIKGILEKLADACATRELTQECPILEAMEDHAVVRH